jgi:hypothetical protein
MEYLSKLLPGFGVWLQTLPFDSYVLHRLIPTGSLFKGNGLQVAYERPGDMPNEKVFECRAVSEEDPVTWWRQRNKDIKVLGKFEPYFLWAKKTFGEKRFFVTSAANNQRSDTFFYGSWSGLNIPGCITQAHLFYDFKVLKLGQVSVSRGQVFSGRNLDFADLDFLTITDGAHFSSWTEISYSSCREVTVENSEMYFVKFHQCRFERFVCVNSSLQDIYLDKSDVTEVSVTNSNLFRIGFSDSDITPFIVESEIRELNYTPPADLAPSKVESTFRLLRSAYQNSGLRQEAAYCYYLERIYERKSYFHPVGINQGLFPGIRYEGRLSLVHKLWRKHVFREGEVLPAVKQALFSKLKLWLTPKLAFRMLTFRWRWLTSLFEYIIWGYGERPARIISCAAIVIFLYAFAFHNTSWPGKDTLDFGNSLYFSIITFTTVGYGDITPSTDNLKILCATEALLGAFTMGLIVAGFSNRSRY